MVSENTWHLYWGAAVFQDDKVMCMTLGVEDIDELEEKITEPEKVKEMRD